MKSSGNHEKLLKNNLNLIFEIIAGDILFQILNYDLYRDFKSRI